MSRVGWILTISLIAAVLAAPAATAHERYISDDGKVSLVLGEQNEPVYTYDWTNLDFIVSEDSENGTGGPVPGVHERVNATLIAPGGEELSLPIEPQFGETGRYEFAEGYYLTQPGQYEVRLEGSINGTDVTGTYKLPGPRQSMADKGFPAEEVPTLLDLQSQLEGLSGEDEENQQLKQQVSQLEQRVATLEAQQTEENGAPGPGPLVAMAALVGVALVALRRDR